MSNGNGGPAWNTVTSYAEAVLNTAVVPLTGGGGWYPGYVQNLQAAQAHARTWLTGIAPAVSSFLPQAITRYGSDFGSVTGVIVSMLGSPPSATLSQQQVEQIQALLEGLETGLQQIIGTSPPAQETILGAAYALDAFMQDLGADYANLGAAAQGAAAELNGGQPSQQQAAALTQIANGVGGLMQMIQQALQALEAVIDWCFQLEQMAANVVQDLRSAGSDTAIPILEELVVLMAENRWQSLVSLVSTPPVAILSPPA